MWTSDHNCIFLYFFLFIWFSPSSFSNLWFYSVLSVFPSISSSVEWCWVKPRQLMNLLRSLIAHYVCLFICGSVSYLIHHLLWQCCNNPVTSDRAATKAPTNRLTSLIRYHTLPSSSWSSISHFVFNQIELRRFWLNNPTVINIWVAPRGSGRAVISDYHLQLLTVFLNVTRSICLLISCVLCRPHNAKYAKKRNESKSPSSFSTLTAK